MKRILTIVVVWLACALHAYAQAVSVTANKIKGTATAPSGACDRQTVFLTTAGALYVCTSGTWALAATGGVSGLTIGTSTITGGTTGRLLYDNAGVVGEISGFTSNGSSTLVQTSSNAAAFESGPNGSTNPVFRLVNSTASAATGLSITGNAAASGVTLTALSSGSNEKIILTPKGAADILANTPNGNFLLAGVSAAGASGAGRIGIGSVSTFGGIWLGNNLTSPSLANYSMLTTGTETLINSPTGSITAFRINNSTIMQVASTGVIFGAADANPPVAQTLSVQNASGSNIAGADWTYKGSSGTGTGATGKINFQLAGAGSSGSSLNTFATVLQLDAAASNATGLSITGNAAGSGVTLTALSSGSNEDIKIIPKGSSGGVQLGTPLSGWNTLLGIGTGLKVQDGSGTIGFELKNDATGLKLFGGSYMISTDVFLRRAAAANWAFGATDAASPVNQKISTQGSRGGTDSNVAGADLTIVSGLGTGNATPSSLKLSSPLIGSSGTTAQTETVGLTIKNGAAKVSSYTVSGLPSASTCGAGAVVMVTDANEAAGASLGSAPTGGGSVKRMVYSDGTNWLLM